MRGSGQRGARSKRGASGGSRDGQRRGTRSEERAVQVGARRSRSEERASGAGSGARWENAAAASGVRCGARIKIRDIEMSRE
jgi:hypothetical protein